jgi:RinA family phage transcriptional activator
MEADQVPSNVFKFVERELYDHEINKETLRDYLQQRQEIEQRMRQRRDNDDVPTELHDGTQGKAISLLLLEDRAERIKRYTQAILCVLNVLNAEERELVKLKYFENNRSNEEVARELNISERQFYKLRQDIVRKFAMRMGLI